ncbi:hypothetical protein [Chromobacterium alticapitis]|uniref:Uncharacterized protein n=1 Tax=Chromobacterium alticapitis TaxID=2073169 RepID=A0A2S5DBF1_9NEIS|nr:hypothetical protein [Chromobacterium alticapitis]POZ60322.1 hypothetical protein C2I19_19515 [Chromobacterium alticapitis]
MTQDMHPKMSLREQKLEHLSWVSGKFIVLVLCYPDRFNEDTGPYEQVLSRLFEEWGGVRTLLKQDGDKAAAVEVEIRRALSLMESGQRKEGKWLLQDIEKELPKLAKLK